MLRKMIAQLSNKNDLNIGPKRNKILREDIACGVALSSTHLCSKPKLSGFANYRQSGCSFENTQRTNQLSRMIPFRELLHLNIVLIDVPIQTILPYKNSNISTPDGNPL